MKECKKCNQIKDLTEFYDKGRNCKKCEIERTKSWISVNREKVSRKRKERYYKNRESELEKKRTYDEKNREKIREKARKSYDSEKAKKYYEENKEEILLRNKKWSDENKEYHRKINVESTKRWLRENPHIYIWRQILYRTIRTLDQEKESSTLEMLNYSAKELKIHIESLFEEGMTWENWGEWHIDHIKPLCTFDKETPAHIVNALSNLRPLWAKENLCRKKR